MASTLACLELDPSPIPVPRLEALERVLESARAGRGQALVVRGERGLGKTKLLEQAAALSASGFRVASVTGVDVERDLAFAGLHRLCTPMLDRIDRVPGPQRDALTAAFGEREACDVDRFFLGLAVLRLFAEASADQPLVCMVDDAHWLDPWSMQLLAFVGRRLDAHSVALVFAASEAIDELQGFPELTLRGLSDVEAHTLLASVLRVPLDVGVRHRIVAESQGNPRSLIELSTGASSEHLAGRFGLPVALPSDDPLAESLRVQLEALPVQTRQLLLVAAAEPEGDAGLLWRAADRLGIEAAAADAAESLGLLDFGLRVTFREPHMRSVVYHDARLEERRRVHYALADAAESDGDPDGWAWHRAHGTLAPDASVADALERSASRVHEVGGAAAAASFLELSVVLTPEPSTRATRALAAAHAKFEAGSSSAARELLSVAGSGPLGGLERARMQRLRALIVLSLSGAAAAAPLLRDAANTLAPFDARLARDTYLEALDATSLAGRFAANTDVRAVATEARSAPAVRAPGAADLLLDGLALLFTDGYGAAASTLRRAIRDFSDSEGTRWIGLACRLAAEVWDSEAALTLASRYARLARDEGALTHVPVALDYLATVHIDAGSLAAATRLSAEADAVSAATGQERLAHSALLLAAWRGSETETLELIRVIERDANRRGNGRQIAQTEYATALLYNGHGRYRDALTALQGGHEREELSSSLLLPELVEAAVRCGEREIALAACERLAAQTQVISTEWALGIEARSRALVTEDERVADKLYRDAIERLGRCHAATQVARAHLLYGEWLRRQSRRLDAREALRAAHEMFSTMGAGAFEARAHRELLATGAHARKRTASSTAQLTPQEAQIAHLARDGDSNPQIAAKLYISARTVEYHLHKVFTKLGISSRLQLTEVLNDHATANNATTATA